ncbi:hypothetical protein EVAR_45840_1 [Eumeta japonica]|uniref:Uncharacterized protein n=1 Tax=Eumeta variegata TaxID=151549 RepID=A0A4C1WL50_EUMVA|nr:hypothetical protein EVAR_45840_1 [Eumeta japonica]
MTIFDHSANVANSRIDIRLLSYRVAATLVLCAVTARNLFKDMSVLTSFRDNRLFISTPFVNFKRYISMVAHAPHAERPGCVFRIRRTRVNGVTNYLLPPYLEYALLVAHTSGGCFNVLRLYQYSKGGAERLLFKSIKLISAIRFQLMRVEIGFILDVNNRDGSKSREALGGNSPQSWRRPSKK